MDCALRTSRILGQNVIIYGKKISWRQNGMMSNNTSGTVVVDRGHDLLLEILHRCSVSGLRFTLQKCHQNCDYKTIYGEIQDGVVVFSNLTEGNFSLNIDVSSVSSLTPHSCIFWLRSCRSNIPPLEVRSEGTLLDPDHWGGEVVLQPKENGAVATMSFPRVQSDCWCSFIVTLHRYNHSHMANATEEAHTQQETVISITLTAEHSVQEMYFRNLTEEFYYMVEISHHNDSCHLFEGVCVWQPIRSNVVYVKRTDGRVHRRFYWLCICLCVFPLAILTYIMHRRRAKHKWERKVSRQVEGFLLYLEKQSEEREMEVVLLHANDGDNAAFRPIMDALHNFLEVQLSCQVHGVYEYVEEMYINGPVEWVREKVNNPNCRVIIVVSERGCTAEKMWATKPVWQHQAFVHGLGGILHDTFQSVFVVRFPVFTPRNLNYQYIPCEFVYDIVEDLPRLAIDLHDVGDQFPAVAEASPERIWCRSKSYNEMKREPSETHIPIENNPVDCEDSGMDDSDSSNLDSRSMLQNETVFDSSTDDEQPKSSI